MTQETSAAAVEPSRARHILQRMGETGQPPERGALRVNVGTDEYLRVLKDEYLIPIRQLQANSTYKLVQAPFGGGKSHFLHCLREVAWQEGFLTALVGVSPKSCPFDDLGLIYRAVVRELESPPASEEIAAEHGIGDLLRGEALKRASLYGKERLVEWLEGDLARARIDSHSFRRAAVLFMKAVANENGAEESLLEAWLRGEDVPASEVRPLGIRDSLDERSAFHFLKSLVQLFHALSAPGLVLLFDELDRAMSLTVRRRRSIADNIREMIDACGQSSLPGLVFVYAVPPEFMTQLVPEYPALEQRLKGAGRLSQLSPLSPVIDLDRVPLSTEELLTAIGHRLLSMYQRAGFAELDAAVQQQNIALLAVETARNMLESGSRRIFVKATVRMLNEQGRSGERRLTSQDLTRLLGRQEHDGPVLEGEELFL